MGFQDVAFLPSRASFSTMFLKNCGRCKSLRTTTCPKTMAWAKQRHAPCKYSCTTKPLLRTAEFNGDHMTAYKDEVRSGHPQFWGYYLI